MVFKKIFRGLIDEREPELKDIPVTKYFNDDNIVKTIQLFSDYNFHTGGGWSDLPYIEVMEVFLGKLKYEVPSTIELSKYKFEPLFEYIQKGTLLKFLHIIEIYSNVILSIVIDRNLRFELFTNFVIDFNNFYDKNSIPFKLHFDENDMKCFILKKENEFEEANKEKVFELLKDKKYEKVNESFLKSIKAYTEGEYKESIEESYKAIEKLTKVLINNHKINFVPAYKQFKKDFSKNIKGIFGHYEDIMFKRIDNIQNTIEQIANEIERHSDKENFDTNEFLEETARFQLNDVMNLIILMFNIVKNG